jgi:hypothetical protein
MWKWISAAFLALTITGCAALTGVLDKYETPIRLAFQIATERAIDGDQDRAQRVVEIVQDARLYVDTDSSASVDRLAEFVHDQIRWHRLSPVERIVVEDLIREATEFLREKVAEGVLSVEDRATIGQVLSWIERAAILSLQE